MFIAPPLTQRALIALFGVLILASSSLSAQQIDHERTRYLGDGRGRPGCYAPLEIVFAGKAGGTATVEILSPGVALRRQVSVNAAGPVTARVPCRVAADSKIRVTLDGASDEFSPEVPARLMAPSYHRIYAAAFAPEAANLPASDTLVFDAFKTDECFADWRMFDGYDAIVLLNPGDGRLPAGAQRALLEFASLGGAVFIAGNFTLESGLPALPDPTTIDFAGVPVLRQSCGGGTLYRVAYERIAEKPADVLVAAMRRHQWYGGSEAPAGAPATRGAENPPPTQYLEVGDRRAAAPSLMVYGLVGLIALTCLLAPLALDRLKRGAWPAFAATALIAVGIAIAGANQSGPLPQVQVSVLELASDGDITARREVWLVPPAVKDVFTVDLANSRLLPRAGKPVTGWRVYTVDLPLTRAIAQRAPVAKFENAYIEGLPFRDFAARARVGETALDETGARLVDWWLEVNAYRGRKAQIVKVGEIEPLAAWPGTETVIRGGLAIIEPR
ncbi:MAG: hypothetical protein IT462_08480 [Planctomycetes bacterium]|nr:hypothetical protein [Planctomycetota bacterium]